MVFLYLSIIELGVPRAAREGMRIMADSKSDPMAKKSIIIAGDDGTLYNLSETDLQQHKMDPTHPAHPHAQKIVADQQHGTITPEHFTAESATVNSDIYFKVLNMGAVKPPDQ
jgi:hypothetical protein